MERVINSRACSFEAACMSAQLTSMRRRATLSPRFFPLQHCALDAIMMTDSSLLNNETPVEDGNDEHDEEQQQQDEHEDRRLAYAEEHHDAIEVSARRARRMNVTADENTFKMSFNPARVFLYSPPRQRQKWGDTQILPRVNWGDLFFDLFYVAATYNVSYILVDQPSGYGILYAMGTFFPTMNIWLQKMYCDSRFVTEDDIFHRCMISLALVLVGCSVLHIRPVKILSHPEEYYSMFTFAFVISVERLMAMAFYLEIYFFGVGQKAMKNSAMRDIRAALLPLTFYVAAAVVAGSEFFSNRDKDEDGSHRWMAEAAEVDEEYESKEPNHIPIALCLTGYIASNFVYFLNVVFCFPSGGRHKEIAVPMNIDFAMHRNGEWTMLMLGESIFSLLIVESAGNRSFATSFYCGILTVIMLQYLHFRSQPHSADNHAMRRNKSAGLLVGYVSQVYSFALVALGAAYTFFLLLAEVDPDRRRLAGDSSAEGDPDADAQKLERAAHLFSGSLATIFFSLDVMPLLHLGWNESSSRCVAEKKVNHMGLVLLFLRVAVLVFTATLSQWEHDPSNLSFVGLVLVVTELVLRKAGHNYLSKSVAEVLGGNGSARWPNVSHARAARTKHP